MARIDPIMALIKENKKQCYDAKQRILKPVTERKHQRFVIVLEIYRRRPGKQMMWRVAGNKELVGKICLPVNSQKRPNTLQMIFLN